jgi:parallel beta-helix repeat protein
MRFFKKPTFLEKLSRKQLISFISFLIILVALPIAIFLARNPQLYQHLGRAEGPEAKPAEVKITNLHGSGFSVLWSSVDLNNENLFVETTGWIEYGTDENNLDQKAYDDRGDENVISTTHHVSLFGLNPEKTYYFKIKSGPHLYGVTGNQWVLGADAFSQNTPSNLSLSGNPQPIYGYIKNQTGATIEGALVQIVFKKTDSETRSSPLSVITKKDEGWIVDIKNARTEDLASLFCPEKGSCDNDGVLIEVGAAEKGNADANLIVNECSPAPNITLIPPITPTPTEECSPVDKTIYVSPPGEQGNCHDLQKAIDNVPGGQYVIRLAPGTYRIPDPGGTFSVEVLNKNDLTIQGDPQSGSDAVILDFSKNSGGINIQGSSGRLEWMSIVGPTTNGLVYLNQSPKFNLIYLHLNDQGANTVQINHCADNEIMNSEIKSGSVALYPSKTFGLRIENNILSDSSHGIEAFESSGVIKGNLFENNKEQAIRLTRPSPFVVSENTIVGSKGTDGHAAFYVDLPIEGTSLIDFQKNIVVDNNGGIEINEVDKIDLLFATNDIWNNGVNYLGIPDQTEQRGNISADPLFGPDYCLNPGSPAIYGEVIYEAYMGHRGPCSEIPTLTPSVSPTASPTPTPTPTPLLTPTQAPTQSPNTANLSFQIKFQGINQQRPDKTVKITLKKDDTPIAVYENIGVSSDQDGIYSGRLMNIQPDTYDIYIKGWAHLQKKFENITLIEGENDQNFSDTLLLAGDIDNARDNRVNAVDLGIVIDHYFPDTPTDSPADLNLDGKVNAIDIGLIIENYLKQGD